MRPLLALFVCSVALAACAGSPTLSVAECPMGGDISAPDAAPCAPFLSIQAESDGEFYRFWGKMSAFPTNRSFEGGTVSVLETERSIEVPGSGRFSIDSLRADQTLRFSSEGYRDIDRNVGSLYQQVRG